MVQTGCRVLFYSGMVLLAGCVMGCGLSLAFGNRQLSAVFFCGALGMLVFLWTVLRVTGATQRQKRDR